MWELNACCRETATQQLTNERRSGLGRELRCSIGLSATMLRGGEWLLGAQYDECCRKHERQLSTSALHPLGQYARHQNSNQEETRPSYPSDRQRITLRKTANSHQTNCCT